MRLSGKESAFHAGVWVWCLGWKDPLGKEMATAPLSLPENSHGQRNLVGYSPWGHKESDTF